MSDLARIRAFPASAISRNPSSRSYLRTQLAEFDGLLAGIPRGALTEVVGSPSSGRTSFVNRFLSIATRDGEYCSVVDSTKAFDPDSAKSSAIEFSRLLWVQCNAVTVNKRLEQAIKCTDLLLHAGGWGVVVLDLCDIEQHWVRRLPTSYWYRFRRAVEDTPTILMVLQRESNVKACAALSLDMMSGQPVWSGAHPDFRVLNTMRYSSAPKRPMRQERPSFVARAIA